MADLRAMSPDERRKRVRIDELKARAGTATALGSLGAVGLMALPMAARSRVLTAALKNTKKPREAREFVASMKKPLDNIATKTFMAAAVPGSAVTLSHSATARQDAKTLRSQIRRDGSLRPKSEAKLAKAHPVAQAGGQAGKTLKPLQQSGKKPARQPSIRSGGMAKMPTGKQVYRRGGHSL